MGTELQSNGRDQRGRFVKGVFKGGPGRPARAVETQYLKSMAESCSIEDWQQIVERAIRDAKNGDSRARTWLSKYLIGDIPPLELHAHLHQAEVERPNAYRYASPEKILKAMRALDEARRSSEANERCQGGTEVTIADYRVGQE